MIRFRKIRWKNFLSTGNHFTEMVLDQTSTTLIVGENGSGKSTFLDALTFALFGKPFRNVNKPQVVNSINTSDCLVEVEFSVGPKTYIIRRGMVPNVFEILCDGKIVNQDSKSRDYQKYLEQTILKLNYKSFTQVVVLGSSTFIPFMQLKASDRRAIIEELLDIQIFSSMNMILKNHVLAAKEEYTALETQYQIAREKVAIQRQYIQTLQNESAQAVADNLAKIQEGEQQATALMKEVLSLRHKAQEIQTRIIDKTKVDQSLRRAENIEKEIQTRIRRHRKNVEFYENTSECPTCRQGLAEDFRRTQIENENYQVTKLQSEVKNLSKIIEKTESRLSEINEALNEIAEIDATINKRLASVEAIEKYLLKVRSEVKQQTENNTKHEGEEQRLADLMGEVSLIETKRQNLTEDRQLYDIASRLLKDDGIKSKIIKQYLPVMNKLINKYLQAMDFFVSFNIDENFSETIKSRHREEFSYASFSEGEKMRIDLALLFTWREIARMKNSANTNLLVLDEVFDSSLDSAGTDEFLKLIGTLGAKTNVFIISHKGDALQDKFAEVVRFEKVGGFSKIAA